MFKISYDKKITMVQGDTGVIRMSINNYDLSQGDEVRFAIVNKANPSILLCQHSDKKIVLEKQVTVFEKDGSARIVIYTYDTEYLQPGKYLYEIQVKTKDGRIDTVVPLTSFTLMDGSIQGEFGQTTPSKPEPTPSEIELRFKRLENEIIPELGNRITNVEKEIDSISSSLNNVMINIKDFGAKGDGVADDTQAIQNAINSLNGGTLLIPNGTYMIKGSKTDNNDYSEDIIVNDVLGLKLKSNITIIFESEKAILKMLPNNASTCTILNLQECENVIIQGGTLDGNKDNQILHEFTTPSGQNGGYWSDQWRTCVLIYGYNKNITFKGINFINSVGDGVTGHTFNINKLPTNITVDSCYFDTIGRSGVHSGGGKNYVVTNCKFVNINKSIPNTCKISAIGVDIEANHIYLEQVLVDNCIFDNVENGVLANYCNNSVIISNCNFINSTYHDIECREGLEQIYVVNNVLSQSLNVFGNNLIAKGNTMNRLFIYSNANKESITKNVLIKDNLIKYCIVWGTTKGENFIFENNNFNYLKDQTTTFTIASDITFTNVTFKNNIFNGGNNGNIILSADVSDTDSYLIFENNTFNGGKILKGDFESQLYNYKTVKIINNVFNNLNGVLGLRVYTSNNIIFNNNNIVYDNAEINPTTITPIKLESVYINAIGNNFVSYLTNAFLKGMYLVNIRGGNSLKLIAHNNVIPTSQFTSPLPIYNFTNYTSATNLL